MLWAIGIAWAMLGVLVVFAAMRNSQISRMENE